MKPNLFNTEMVRALLEGRKTVTRRLVKPAHLNVLNSQYHIEHPEVQEKTLIEKLCQPPYQPGDILYVRETWRVQSASRFDAAVGIMFKAGGMTTIQFPGRKSQATSRDEYDTFIAKWMQGGGWHPSIHMPKEAARIFLKVTDVRVERLQEIDEDGAILEGFPYIAGLDGKPKGYSRIAFAQLWDSTIKPADRKLYGWEANPWVWVIEFERCEKPEEARKKEEKNV